MGTTLRGDVFFRMAINAVLTTITSIKTIAHAVTFLPAFGLPAIMASLRCRFDAMRSQVFPKSVSEVSGRKELRHPSWVPLLHY